MKELFHKRIYLFLASLYLITLVVYIAFRNKTYWDFLLWNLFLAWIPLVASALTFVLYQRKQLKLRTLSMILSGALWLLFLPNAPYVLTDFVHVTVLKNSYLERGRLNLNYWYDFLVISLFVWTSLLSGAISTYQIHYIIRKHFNNMLSWVFVVTVSFLSGYGILLGREYRLNSWDVFTDWKLVTGIIEMSFTGRALLFWLLFGLVIHIVYVTFYVMINGAAKPDNNG